MPEVLRVPGTGRYKIVKLVHGAHSVHSLAHRETFHPVIGPVAEAEALYVRQLRLTERLQEHSGGFVLWDVGLGAAANAVTVLRAAEEILRVEKIRRYDLQVDVANTRAIAFYKKHGFAIARTLKDYYANGKDAYLMIKELGELRIGDWKLVH